MSASAGYSGTPLVAKLGIKAGHRVLLDRAPERFVTDVLGELPDSVVVARRAGRTAYDVVLAFRPDVRTYTAHLARDIGRITIDGSLWIAWPKRASGVATDLTGDVVRREALAAGVVDVKVCAVDETWSALKLVHRVENRGRR
jgi:hypothetical protein